jgi:superfamily II DNA helicase RecQ
MRVRIVTLRFSPTLGGFDDTALLDLQRDHEVLSFREHFFIVQDVPHVACVVEWQEKLIPRPLHDVEPREPPRPSSADATRPDPQVGLTESDRLLFNTLREWRSKTARHEGVPPYVVFTNRQLLAIVARKPDSRTALSNVDGVGPAKVERHGSAILGLLGKAGPPTPGAAPPQPPMNAEALLGKPKPQVDP